MKRIGFVSFADPFSDRKAWSGTIFKLREAIEAAGYEVIWIPYDTSYQIDSLWSKLNNHYWEIRKRLFHKNILGNVHSRSNARRYAKSIDVDKIEGCDYLFFPGGAQIGLFLKTSVPIIYLADATVHQMIDYYWYNIDKAASRIAKDLEKKASLNSLINIRSSKWAIDSVINDCKCDKNKCFVLEFGPNIDTKDITPNSYFEGGRLNILFSGVDWKRKGGDIAVETVELLREKGIDAHLIITGPQNLPEKYQGIDFIEYYGFLDKNNHNDYNNYIQLCKISHIFLLPTKAECAGIVFCESAAFGNPSYTFATGGTTDYVISDYNGYAFPTGCTSNDFADKIYNDIKQGKIKVFHDNALNLYNKRLSWEAWASHFKAIVSDFDKNDRD